MEDDLRLGISLDELLRQESCGLVYRRTPMAEEVIEFLAPEGLFSGSCFTLPLQGFRPQGQVGRVLGLRGPVPGRVAQDFDGGLERHGPRARAVQGEDSQGHGASSLPRVWGRWGWVSIGR